MLAVSRTVPDEEADLTELVLHVAHFFLAVSALFLISVDLEFESFE